MVDHIYSLPRIQQQMNHYLSNRREREERGREGGKGGEGANDIISVIIYMGGCGQEEESLCVLPGLLGGLQQIGSPQSLERPAV